MNVLSGAYAPSHGAIPTELAVRLTREHDGVRDSASAFSGPCLLMIHQAFPITPEDAHQAQPYVANNGDVITWDGRLDNRDELRRALSVHRQDSSDVELVARAFSAWGIQCVDRLIGDWSVAIFDSAQRTLHLASDYMGNRTLYYAQSGPALVWATQLESLIQFVECFDDLAHDYFIATLAGARLGARTPYRSIRGVMAGHVVTVSRTGRVTEAPVIRLHTSRVRYRRVEDYAEQLRALFAEAVAVRLRACGPVWMDLSGGWDSSSIVCMASHLLKTQNVAAPALHTFSILPGAASHTSELRFIRSVETHTAIPATHFTTDGRPAPLFWVQPDRVSPERWAMASHMVASNSRVILSGGLGDGIMANYPDASEAALEYLHWSSLPRFLQELLEWSIANRDTVWHGLAWCIRLRTRGLRAIPSASASHPPMPNKRNAGDLFHSKHRALVQHLKHEVAEPRLVDGYDAQMSRLVEAVSRFSSTRHCRSPEMLSAIRMSFPYTHRPLVETALSFPLGILAEPHRPRALMRRAFADLLPAEIVRRFSKGHAMPELLHIAQRDVAVLKSPSLRLVEMEIVDPAALSVRIGQLADGSLANAGDLLKLARLERWLRERHALRANAA